MGKFHDLTGQKFGKLTVIEHKGKNAHKHTLWLCRCECGNKIIIRSGDLVTGSTKSCGCSRQESLKKHGKRNTRLYNIWANMIQRCTNQNIPAYKNYGARGIVVCDEWHKSFASFYEWATTHGYSDELTIERIDVNGNYAPEN